MNSTVTNTQAAIRLLAGKFIEACTHCLHISTHMLCKTTDPQTGTGLVSTPLQPAKEPVIHPLLSA